VITMGMMQLVGYEVIDMVAERDGMLIFQTFTVNLVRQGHLRPAHGCHSPPKLTGSFVNHHGARSHDRALHTVLHL